MSKSNLLTTEVAPGKPVAASSSASQRPSGRQSSPDGIRSTFPQDFLASIVVFLVALPLCMGIAIASGAPPAAGLITGIIGGLVTGALSGCPLQVSGPAAGLAVIVYDIVQKHGFEMLGPIIVVAGILQLIAGVVRFGQIFRAIAPAVVYGMLAGIGILIFGAQFHVMVDDAPRSNGILNLISIPEAVYKGIFPVDGSTHHMAAALGLVTIAVMVGWAGFAPRKLKWIPGALIAVTLATVIAQALAMPVRYVNLPDSLFSALQLPATSNFLRMIEPQFIVAALTLAFVASAETLLSATAVDQMHDGPRANYDREMLSQGVGNTLSGLAGGLPMTGVIVRSATNVAAGAKTRHSAIMHGVWLLLFVAALPFVLRMVPTASLAAVLVYTGYKLVNPDNVRRLLRFGGAPVIIYAATVIMIVATDLLIGIITGLVLSVVKVLWALSRLHIDVQHDTAHSRYDVHVTGAATFLRMPRLVDALTLIPEGSAVHLHLRGLMYIDHACFDAIADWERKRAEKGAPVVVEWQEARDRYFSSNDFPGIAKPRHPEPHVQAGSAH
jgi:MFS superfamily sulfate permease-like transporter